MKRSDKFVSGGYTLAYVYIDKKGARWVRFNNRTTDFMIGPVTQAKLAKWVLAQVWLTLAHEKKTGILSLTDKDPS